MRLMALIRRLVYKTDYRPKFGTILYSPTLHFQDVATAAFDTLLSAAVMFSETEPTYYMRLPEDCYKCNGNIWNGWTWVKTRETIGMVCPACGTDYAKEE